MKKDLIGIIACGGSSSRMGSDKSLLVYHALPQRYHIYEMLEGLCSKVYISCNKVQARSMDTRYNYIIDNPELLHAGPLTACLSAISQFPESNILLIGCDYPFLSRNEVDDFITFFSGKNLPAAFFDPESKCYIPVLGYYPAGSETKLIKWQEDKSYSLQQFLKETSALKYIPKDLRCMTSIDTPEAMTHIDTTI